MTSFDLMNTNMAEENESRKSDDYTLRVEAQEALKEISFAVSHVELSQVLLQGAEKVYLNVKIQEGDTYCVELSVQGFRVSVAYSVVFPPRPSFDNIYELMNGNVISAEGFQFFKRLKCYNHRGLLPQKKKPKKKTPNEPNVF